MLPPPECAQLVLRARQRLERTAAAGVEHLAVIGEERETRDGHYTYGTAPPFDSIRPLTCYNQTGVFHWLEGMINHHLGKGGRRW
jgi:hypothetical protein